MKKWLLILFLSVAGFGQGFKGNITTSGSDCHTTNACVVIPLNTDAAALALNVPASPSFTGTLQFEQSVDCVTWVSITGNPQPTGSGVTSATAAGTWVFSVSGMKCFRVRASAFASGTASIVGNAIGASGVVNDTSGTAGTIALFTSNKSIGNSHLDDGVTTASTITSTEPIAVPSIIVSPTQTSHVYFGLNMGPSITLDNNTAVANTISLGPTWAGSVTVSSESMVYMGATIMGPSMTDFYSMFIDAVSNSGGTITNNHGLYLASQAGVGTNNNALDIADQGGASTDHAINVAGGRVEFGSTAGDGEVITSGSNGENESCSWKSENLTLSTSATHTDTSANLLPSNAVIKSVTARVTTTIATATNWELGDGTTAGRFTPTISTLTAGTTTVGSVYLTTGIASATTGMWQTSAAPVRVTTTGTPSAGAIRISVLACSYTPPTS